MQGYRGKWLRGPLIWALARRVGHESNLEQFLGTTELPSKYALVEGFDHILLAERRRGNCSTWEKKSKGEQRK